MSYVITPEEETFKSYIFDEYKEVRGHKVVFEGWEEFSFFVYGDAYGWWHLIEESTGLSLPEPDHSKELTVKGVSRKLRDRRPNWLRNILQRSKAAIESKNYSVTKDLALVPCGE